MGWAARGGVFITDQSKSAEAIQETLDVVQRSLEDDKAENVVVIDLRGKTSIGDYMIIASGRSQRHVSAVAEHLIQNLKAAHTSQVHTEGLRQGDWVLIDTGDIIVHLFRPEVREFYNLEKMWSPGLTEDRRAGTES